MLRCHGQAVTLTGRSIALLNAAAGEPHVSATDWSLLVLTHRIVNHLIGEAEFRTFRLIFGFSHERYLYAVNVLLWHEDAPDGDWQRRIRFWDKKQPGEAWIPRRLNYAKPDRLRLAE
jgi:hypothetical protein